MGSSKDGKLGIDMGASICDCDRPTLVKFPQLFFKNKIAQTELKQYHLFDDYDEYGTLNPVMMKNNWGEITQIACGENYQMFVSNFGELYGCGSNKYG